MACVIWVGPVGSGKTFNAWADALAHQAKFIYHNLPDLAPLKELPVRRRRWKWFLRLRTGLKTLVYWNDFDTGFGASRCGLILADEIHLWLDARKWDEMNPIARRKISEHRKDHLKIVGTAQHASFLDRIYRILADEIRLVHEISLPLIGWLFWDCRRKPIACPHCQANLTAVERDFFGGHPERMTKGDRSFWGKLFGFGTLYYWWAWPPAALVKNDSATDDELLLDGKLKPKGFGIRLFSQRIADQYSTIQKLSGVAAAAVAGRHSRHGDTAGGSHKLL